MTLVLFIIIFIVPVVFPYKFPEKFQRCHIKDADLDNCLKTTIQNALQLIGAKGIPSLHIPSIEPIEVTKLEIGEGKSSVSLVQRYENVKLYGHSSATVENAHLDLDNKVLTFTMKMPKLEQIAKYNINGKIMVLPVYGSGDSKITLSGAKIIHTIKFKEEIKNKKVYFKIISYRSEFTVENAHFQFENLFNGDKQLAENILKVLNENGRVLFEDASEGIDNSYAEVYKNIATRFFQNVPVDDIFLP